MPNSKIPFYCSMQYSKSIGSLPFRGVIPDIYFDYGHIPNIKDRYYLNIDILNSIIKKHETPITNIRHLVDSTKNEDISNKHN